MNIAEKAQSNITRVDTPRDLAVAAFEMFINDANKAIRSMGSFNVAISGGDTPAGFFELLGDRPESRATPAHRGHG